MPAAPPSPGHCSFPRECSGSTRTSHACAPRPAQQLQVLNPAVEKKRLLPALYLFQTSASLQIAGRSSRFSAQIPVASPGSRTIGSGSSPAQSPRTPASWADWFHPPLLLTWSTEETIRAGLRPRFEAITLKLFSMVRNGSTVTTIHGRSEFAIACASASAAFALSIAACVVEPPIEVLVDTLERAQRQQDADIAQDRQHDRRAPGQLFAPSPYRRWRRRRVHDDLRLRGRSAFIRCRDSCLYLSRAAVRVLRGACRPEPSDGRATTGGVGRLVGVSLASLPRPPAWPNENSRAGRSVPPIALT